MKRTTSFCDNIEQWRSWPLNRPFTKQTNVLLINCSNQQKKRLLIGCKPFFQVHISFIVIIIINIGHVNHILLSATLLITVIINVHNHHWKLTTALAFGCHTWPRRLLFVHSTMWPLLVALANHIQLHGSSLCHYIVQLVTSCRPPLNQRANIINSIFLFLCLPFQLFFSNIIFTALRFQFILWQRIMILSLDTNVKNFIYVEMCSRRCSTETINKTIVNVARMPLVTTINEWKILSDHVFVYFGFGLNWWVH